MFVDYTKITVKAGKGGDGAVSFHREKYIAAGGPDGGDGGNGGNVYFAASKSLNTLADFRYHKKFAAGDGENGKNKNMTGKSGEDIIVKVPYGTLVRDAATGALIKDVCSEEKTLIAKGGKGGWGNARFSNAVRQIPRFSKLGTSGEEFEVILELKLIADVGLLGFPNAGKSTLLSVVSAARPKIADYPFTTVTPQLGVVRVGDEESFVMADIPGIIEGASEGAGLGHRFLRHIERCRLLLHLIDVSDETRSVKDDLEVINGELSAFSDKLAGKPQVIVATKKEICSEERIEEAARVAAELGAPFYAISAVTGEGVKEMTEGVWKMLESIPAAEEFEPEKAPEKKEESGPKFTVRKENGVYYVEGGWIERILATTDTDDYESLMNLQKLLKREGVFDELERAGVMEHDTVDLCGFEFEFIY
ncbi:MAG: GTPase ObgE [Clostridia bacterium]|nr:GTPase ObgE [Clostridia bacterium]